MVLVSAITFRTCSIFYCHHYCCNVFVHICLVDRIAVLVVLRRFRANRGSYQKPDRSTFNPHSDRVQLVVAALSAANYLEAAIAISSGLRAGALRKTDRAIEVGRDEKTLVAHRKPP